jgi:hypothetical protein
MPHPATPPALLSHASPPPRPAAQSLLSAPLPVARRLAAQQPRLLAFSAAGLRSRLAGLGSALGVDSGLAAALAASHPGRGGDDRFTGRAGDKGSLMYHGSARLEIPGTAAHAVVLFIGALELERYRP